jgi:pyrimidine-nucleoside phosphorylase
MSDRSRAEELAARMIRVGEEAGVRTVAFITSMEEPLGYRIGNWIEIEECIQALQNKGPDDLMEVTHCLAGAMIDLGGKADSFEAGERQSRKMITTGKAWEKFLEMVKAQGGDISYLEHPEKYKASTENQEFHADKDGHIEAMDAYQIGMASVLLGAGRQAVEDSIDPVAGIILHKKTGDTVRKGDAIMTLFADKPDKIEAGMSRIKNSVYYTERKPENRPLILNYMDKTTVK